MSYARWGADSSDVYVYASAEGVTCCGCPLLSVGARPQNRDFKNFDARSTKEIVAHLNEHVAAGDDIPDGIIERLEEDSDRNFPRPVKHVKRHGKA